MRPADLTGLPDGVADHLAETGIEELYPPQAEAVEAGVTDGESLVASVPTASGKTLIAELAMLSTVARGGTALYIVPLRALASEKRDEFAQFEEFGVSVGMSTGNYDADGEWLADQDVVVATSEKVDSLVRNGASWIDDVDCVVADEVHLIDDPNRGPTLEVTLAKLRQLNPALQVVALSATVGNADDVADWLDAELVDTDWRPIELRKGVHYGNALHFGDGEQRELRVRGNEKQTAAIVRDTAEDGGSSLVFVNSRRNAEASADRLGDVIEPTLDGEEREALAAVADEIRAVSETETSEDLADCVERGAAFHHAGLASDHRSLVEDAFRDRLLKVVSATPTLAAGVNTPSRRVVVRDWRRYDGAEGGMVPLSVLEVHQMMGRAGRPGLDPYGEAVLLAASHDELEELEERYVHAEPEPIRSKLAAEPALRTHALATVASGFARSRDELLAFLEETLYAAQSDDPGRLERVTDDVLQYLDRNEFVDWDDDGLAATSLGHTVSRLYLDPMSAAEIVDGLRAYERSGDRAGGGAAGTGGTGPDREREADAGDGFTQATELTGDGDGDAEADADPGPTPLGLYHLVCRTPDTYQLYLKSGDRTTYTELFYEHEPEFLGSPPSEFEEERFEDWLSALKTAKLLDDWAAELDEDRLTERYGVGPGDIRGKVDTAEWLLGATETIATTLDLGHVPAIRAARKRVQHGVREELLELVGVREVGRKRARRLYAAGIESREDLRNADKSVVLGALRGKKTAETVLENAGRMDASMEGVSPDPTANYDPSEGGGDGAATGDREDEASEDDQQASLGDF